MSFLSIFLHYASKNHMVVTKRVLRYLKDTLSFGIKFNKFDSFELQCYSYTDWIRTLDEKNL